MQKDASPNARSHLQQLNVDLGEVAERNGKLRSAYLSTCEALGVKPCSELVTALNINPLNSKNKKKFLFRRLSLCHVEIFDKDFEAIIKALEQQGQGISELIFNHNNITDEGVCQHLVPFLIKDGIVIHTLELFGNKVGNESCRHFSQVLRSNQTLLRLKLGDNCVTTQGTQYLADGLRHNQTLIQLHIGGNNIGDAGVSALANALQKNTTLTSLGLRDNDIGLAGVKALTELLSLPHCSLAEVQLKGNRIGLNSACEVLAQALSQNCSLRVLELQSNRISADGAQALCQSLCRNTCIHAINFNDNALMDEGAEHVSSLLMSNPGITTVGLSGNSIAKRGASALWRALQHSNNTLIGIDLGNNNLGNAGAIGLANVLRSNATLLSIDLNNNAIFAKGIVQMANALTVNTVLRHLDIGTNHSANEGAIAIARALAFNSSLTRLCLTDNEIQQEGGEALYQYLKNNTTLRNFNYGGQGASANKIHPYTRRLINSIITRNRREWHTANTIHEPAEDDEEDDILPELHGNGRDSEISDLGIPLSAAEMVDASPSKTPTAMTSGSRQLQPRTPQRNKWEMTAISIPVTHEGVCTSPSPAPTPPALAARFQSLSHQFRHCPPSPGPPPPSSPSAVHLNSPALRAPQAAACVSPSMEVAGTPPPIFCLPNAAPHTMSNTFGGPSSHYSVPHPSPHQQAVPSRQALDIPMAGTELDLLPDPDGHRATPMALAPAPYRFPSYRPMPGAFSPSSSTSTKLDQEAQLPDGGSHPFLPSLSPAVAQPPHAMFRAVGPPQLMPPGLGPGPRPPGSSAPFLAGTPSPSYATGSKGGLGHGQGHGFSAPQVRAQRQVATSTTPPSSQMMTNCFLSQPVMTPSPTPPHPPMTASQGDLLPAVSKFGTTALTTGAAAAKHAGKGCSKGSGPPGMPFTPVRASASSGPAFTLPSMTSAAASVSSGQTLTSQLTHVSSHVSSATSSSCRLPPAPQGPSAASTWDTTKNTATGQHKSQQKTGRAPPSHSTPRASQWLPSTSTNLWGSSLDNTDDSEHQEEGIPRPPEAASLPGATAPVWSIEELLSQVCPSRGEGSDDDGPMGPASLLKGPDPFQTISQHVQPQAAERPRDAGGGGDGSGGGGGAGNAAEDEEFAEYPITRWSEAFKTFTLDPAKPQKEAGKATDPVPTPDAARADKKGRKAAPACMRAGAAAAAAFVPSAAAAVPPRDPRPFGSSVFAPRASDLHALCPNER